MFAVGGYAEDRGGCTYSHVTVKWSVHIASPPVKGAMILDVPSKAKSTQKTRLATRGGITG
jgi:hypothetical protein